MFTFLQRLIPQHLFSRLVGKAVISKNILLKNLLVSAFSRAYAVSLEKRREKLMRTMKPSMIFSRENSNQSISSTPTEESK